MGYVFYFFNGLIGNQLFTPQLFDIYNGFAINYIDNYVYEDFCLYYFSLH